MHKVTVQPSGQTFEVEEGEAVLTAALRQGVMLPYGCKNGACGSCKGKIVSGAVDYGHYHARVLTEAERAHGKALFCQAKPLGELVIECRTIGAAKDVAVRLLPCRVQQLEKVADDVMIVRLKLPANERLQFLAGQYIDFLLKGGERRSFSMANSPHADELVELHIRHVAGGNFTDHVFGKMKERDILRLEGPLGSFFLREDSDKPIVLLASGTGFAPIKAIIEHLRAQGSTRPAVLYWGCRHRADLYQHDWAVAAAAAMPNLRYVPVLSEPRPDDDWQGRVGFVHRAVMADLPDLSAHEVYACGAPVMVDSAKRDFVAACGLPEEAFYADSFTSEADKHGG